MQCEMSVKEFLLILDDLLLILFSGCSISTSILNLCFAIGSFLSLSCLKNLELLTLLTRRNGKSYI